MSADSHSRSRGRNGSYSTSTQLTGRELLTPDEVLRIPNDELLVVIRGHNVLKLRKLDYEKLPMAKQIVRTSIMDYSPAPAFVQPSQTDFTPPPEEQKPAGKKRKSLYSSAAPPTEF